MIMKVQGNVINYEEIKNNLKEITAGYKISTISQPTQKFTVNNKIVIGYHIKNTKNHGYSRETAIAYRKSDVMTRFR